MDKTALSTICLAMLVKEKEREMAEGERDTGSGFLAARINGSDLLRNGTETINVLYRLYRCMYYTGYTGVCIIPVIQVYVLYRLYRCMYYTGYTGVCIIPVIQV